MKKISFLILTLFYSSAFAQTDRTEVLTEISAKIKQNYINENVLKSVDSLFQSEIKSKNFNALNEKEFTETLTQKLRTVAKDKHFFIKYLENYTPQKKIDDKEQEKQNNFHNSLENFGFEKSRTVRRKHWIH